MRDGNRTEPFPNPLAPLTNSIVVGMTKQFKQARATQLTSIERHAAGIAVLAGLAAGVLAAPASVGATTAPSGTSTTLFKFRNPAINESSGIALADGVYWTHNDGPVNKFYAVNSGGYTLATFTVPNQPTSGSDWEDMATGTDEQGVPSLFFGDIGDNGRTRKEIAVVRVARPKVDTAKLAVVGTATNVVRYRFTYPDGAHDAESLLVQPGTNRIFIVSKAAGGGIYSAPAKPSTTTVNTLTKIGTVTIPGATGASFSTDGKKMVVRQYRNAALYTVNNGDLTAAIKTTPVSLTMPSQLQGEAITFAPGSSTFVLSSEGQYAPTLSQIS